MFFLENDITGEGTLFWTISKRVKSIVYISTPNKLLLHWAGFERLVSSKFRRFPFLHHLQSYKLLENSYVPYSTYMSFESGFAVE